MKRFFARFLLCITILVFLSPSALPGTLPPERILQYKSHIQIHPDGSMTVGEDIQVFAAGRAIRHGIYRDFPTTYRGPFGTSYKVSFHLLRVLRDGRPEPYHTKKLSNGVRVYIGSRNAYVSRGIHTYTIVYKTSRQIGFFKDHDELYWNVTGNGWAFPIEHVEASVTLPHGGRILRLLAFTGRMGARGTDYKATSDSAGHAYFETTRPLQPREGLSIVVAWPKGIVHEPTTREKLWYEISDNIPVFSALLGLIVLLLYYLVTWSKVGKDPEKGTVIPRFHPPDGVSPAGVRYIMKMGFDMKTLAVAIVDMAVRGALRIIQDEDKVYTLEKTDVQPEALSKGERKILDALLGGGSIVLNQGNHEKIKKAVKALKAALASEYERHYFIRNVKYFIPGVVLTFLVLGVVVLTSNDLGTAASMGLWLTIWTGGCFFLLRMVVSAWRARERAIRTTLFALPFLAFEIFGLFVFSMAVSVIAMVLFFLMVLLDLLFYQLLKAPTRHGRRIMDEIEGFKMYLETAEEERLKLMHPPEKTPELFERYLPYAMALDVENQWSRKFEDVLAAAVQAGEYQPVWYNGYFLDTRGLTGMTSSLGSSLSDAIAASSAAPGSSSGFGGGGGSGGGGGGGGGGGW